MAVSTAPVLAAAVVLAIAGIAKIARPTGTVVALRAVGIPAIETAVVALGVVELILGAAVVVWSAPALVALLGLFYAGFAIFSALHLHRNGAGASCGCFGEAETPVSRIHVVVNLAIAAWCAASIGAPPSAIGTVPVTMIATSVVLAGILIAVLTALPRSLAGRSKSR